MKTRSLVFKISAVIGLILFMTIGLFLMYSVNAYNASLDVFVETQKGAAAVSANQIAGEIKMATTVLYEIADDYMANTSDYTDKSPIKRYFSSLRTASLLEVKIANNNCIGALFFQYGADGEALVRFGQPLRWNEKIALNDYLLGIEDFENDVVTERRHVVSVDGQHYLRQVFRLNESSFGVLININSLLRAAGDLEKIEEVGYAITDANGEALAATRELPGMTVAAVNDRQGSAGKPVVSQDGYALPIADTGLTLCGVWLGGVPAARVQMPFVSIGIGVVILLFIIGFSFYLRRQILTPVNYLLRATQKVEGGDLDYRIENRSGSHEFDTLIVSFNYMISEIKNLKISSYEEKLNKQLAELKFLQMQLKPHFYLNAISTISSLSMQGKNKEIEKYILALSEYLRYMITDNLSLVTVEDEINHALAYIKLQRTLAPDAVFVLSEVDDGVRHIKIPKLIVQTFTENIFKHAYKHEHLLSVFISARRETKDGADYAVIVVDDNGEGFSQNVLNGLLGVSEESLGIKNVMRTLFLTYGQEGLLELCNNTQGGARVKIRIPYA